MWEGNRESGRGVTRREEVLSNTRRAIKCFTVFLTGVLKWYLTTARINAFTTRMILHRINLHATVKYTYIFTFSLDKTTVFC
jgi:hypothetical protein